MVRKKGTAYTNPTCCACRRGKARSPSQASRTRTAKDKRSRHPCSVIIDEQGTPESQRFSVDFGMSENDSQFSRFDENIPELGELGFRITPNPSRTYPNNVEQC